MGRAAAREGAQIAARAGFRNAAFARAEGTHLASPDAPNGPAPDPERSGPEPRFPGWPATRGSAAPVAVGIASEETKMGYPGDDRSGGGDRWQGREPYRGREQDRGGY